MFHQIVFAWLLVGERSDASAYWSRTKFYYELQIRGSQPVYSFLANCGPELPEIDDFIWKNDRRATNAIVSHSVAKKSADINKIATVVFSNALSISSRHCG